MLDRFWALWSGFDAMFWGAITGGVVLKILLSEKMQPTRIFVTIICAVFCGVFLTPVVMDFLKVEGENYEYAIVALLALTGEAVMRRVIKYAETGTFADIKKGMK